MKIRLSLVIALGALLTLSILVVGGQESEDFTFRRTRWGMSRSEVTAREGLPDEVEKLGSGRYSRALYYGDTEVAGINATMFFFFTDNKLTRSGYLFTETYNDKNNHIDNFKKIKGIVSDKYGPPEVNKKEWYNDLFKGYPDDYGFAVSKGHLVYKAVWETKESKIFLTLRGKDVEVTHMIDYYSTKLENLVEKREEEGSQSQF